MKGDLLWVYEGLTEYLGEILTPRSGLWTPEQYREYLAETAAFARHTNTGGAGGPSKTRPSRRNFSTTAGDDYNGYRRRWITTPKVR